MIRLFSSAERAAEEVLAADRCWDADGNRLRARTRRRLRTVSDYLRNRLVDVELVAGPPEPGELRDVFSEALNDLARTDPSLTDDERVDLRANYYGLSLDQLLRIAEYWFPCDARRLTVAEWDAILLIEILDHGGIASGAELALTGAEPERIDRWLRSARERGLIVPSEGMWRLTKMGREHCPALRGSKSMSVGLASRERR